MTDGDVRAALADMQRVMDERDDDESAHVMEKNLWHDVLQAIASGATNARELAATALKSDDIDFSRWFA
jgi:hypothetical protein